MKNEAVNNTADTQDNCARPYRLGRRETAMEETSVRILAAARDLLVGENALAGFSMEAVARQAGITRMTLYGRFGSKRGLLEALFDEMGMRGRLRETLPAVFAQTDPHKALQAYIEAFCEFWASDRALNRRLRGFAALDQEFEAAIASRNERRYQAFETLLRRLHQFHPQETMLLFPESKELIQTLLALTSFEFYDVLAGERTAKEAAPIVFHLVLAAIGTTPGAD